MPGFDAVTGASRPEAGVQVLKVIVTKKSDRELVKDFLAQKNKAEAVHV